ncbi:threonine transporter RhtB [Veronia nyctiphanis]|uniref:Threonine transporter RhtB n=1 Tax=Veronia nyctiphanis TaxID=1278244 RepID=A0A4Q0YN28_9GAMM|nr:LysE family translocator [Veronia nyctiphanis]RXJ72206.1 threonine transporter RhtB [Veronia nyctiphanis]
MTISSSIALFIAMLLSAAIPGPSVLAVVSRSMASGKVNGLLVVAGVLVADYIFIFLALSGLSAIADVLGEFASFIKFVGISYLFWLAFVTWNSNPIPTDKASNSDKQRHSSFFAGLLMTLANPKAILFYMGFFPAFINIESIGIFDMFLIILISTVSVGSILSFYAVLSAHAGNLYESSFSQRFLNKLSGGAFATCGVVLATKT